MYVIVAYDIPDDRRRNRVARVLEGFGQRVQYSVFECELEERHLRRLVDRLRRIIQPDDAVRIYRLPRWDERDVLVLGGATKVESPRVIIT